MREHDKVRDRGQTVAARVCARSGFGTAGIRHDCRTQSGIARCADVGVRIPDQPMSRHPAQSHPDRRSIRLVAARVPRPDERLEAAGPAEAVRLAPKIDAVLVGHDGQGKPGSFQTVQTSLGAGQERERVQVPGFEGGIEHVARPPPVFAEHLREAFASRPGDVPQGLAEAPARQAERTARDRERVMDDRPIVHQRPVPVEEDDGTGHAAASPCSI